MQEWDGEALDDEEDDDDYGRVLDLDDCSGEALEVDNNDEEVLDVVEEDDGAPDVVDDDDNKALDVVDGDDAEVAQAGRSMGPVSNKSPKSISMVSSASLSCTALITIV